MPNSKTENRWNNCTNLTSSNLNIPKQATNSTTTSTTPNTFSTPPSGLLYRLSSQRRKISTHPETGSTTTARPFADLRDVADDEGEVGKAHRSLDDQKEGTVTKTNTEKAQAPLHERNTDQKQKTQTNEQHNNDNQPLTTKLNMHE